MGSRRYPGRRPLKGWQLTALVGVVGALGRGRLQQQQQQQSAPARRHQHQFAVQRYVGSRRLGHVGLDRVVGEPHHDQLRTATPGRC